jgi:hypothetical protein
MIWWHLGTTSAFEHFQRAVQQQFSFLETLGYEHPTFSTEKDPLTGRGYSAEYHRDDRGISIHATDSWHERNVVSVLVWRLPRGTVDDDMDLDVFAEKHSPDIAAALLNAADKTIKSAVADSFPLYAALLAGAARGMITGEHWEIGLYREWT